MYGGSSVNGVSTEPHLALRKHRYQSLTMDDTVRLGLWPAEAAAYVKAAFRAGFNVIIAGDWNSGKTTTLRALCLDAIPKSQRVITVEAGLTELGLHKSPEQLENVVALFSVSAVVAG